MDFKAHLIKQTAHYEIQFTNDNIQFKCSRLNLWIKRITVLLSCIQKSKRRR